MKVLLIFLAVYVVSMFAMYMWVRIAYSKGGIRENQYLDHEDLVITFFPVLNTFCIIIGWIFYFPKKTRKINYNKFFNVK